MAEQKADAAPPASFCDWVQHWAQLTPDKVCNYWLDRGGGLETHMTFAELWNRSSALVEHLTLAEDGPHLRRGDRALICFPIGLEFLPAFIACLRAGIVAVSVYPPNPAKLAADLHGLQRVAEDCGGCVALTSASLVKSMKLSRLAGVQWPECIHTWVPTDDVAGLTALAKASAPLQPWQLRVKESNLPAQDPQVQPNDLAFLQYTSGSTGRPKGVMVTHAGLLYNLNFLNQICRTKQDSEGVMWVPQYHDMGLIAVFLLGLRVGGRAYNFSPFDFLRAPANWLTAIQRYRATFAIAPNFGWALAMSRAKAQGIDVDLSCLQVAGMGGEPNLLEVQAAMISQLRIVPDRVNVFYGCAEMVLIMCGDGRGFHPTKAVASCGSVSVAASYGSDVIVVDRHTRAPVPDGVEGVILAKSPSKCLGYYNVPDLTAKRFHCLVAGREADGYWYDTHDLGFIENDQLYVLGRQDDVIIINGRNVFPTDVEVTVNRQLVDIVRPGSTIAVQTSADSISIVVECRPGKLPTAQMLQATVAEVETTHAVVVNDLVAVAKGTVPRTTSGKVKRRAVRAMLHQRTMPALMTFRCSADEGHISVTVDGTVDEPAPLSPESWQAFCMQHGIIDLDATILDNGVDSLRLQRFSDAAYKRFQIRIDPALIDTAAVRDLPFQANGGSATNLKRFIDCWQSPPGVAWIGEPCGPGWRRGLRQTLGLLIVLALVAIAAIPSAAVMQAIIDNIDIHDIDPYLMMFDQGPGLLIPVAVVVWMASFTVILIAAKWLVIGKYRPVGYAMWSWPFWRWWLVDRIADVWMTFVGSFLRDTPYLNVVYWLLGAKIPIGDCRLQVPIREWDLFSAGFSTKVSGTVLLRCVNQQGVWMSPVTLPADHVVEAHQIVMPGESIVSGSAPSGPIPTHNSYVVQRLVAPLVSVVFYELGLVAGSWATQSLVDYTAIRWLSCAVVTSLTTVVLGVLLCNSCRWTVLVDRVCSSSVFLLQPWFDWVVTSMLWRMYGARIGVATIGKMGAIAPSECTNLIAGSACMIPLCQLDMSKGPIVLEDVVSVGLGAHVASNCRLRSHSRVFPMSAVPSNTIVDRDAMFLGDHNVASMGNVGVTVNYWDLLRLEVLHWLVAALVRWAPQALVLWCIVRLLEAIADGLSDWSPYLAAPVTLFLILISAAGCWSVLHVLAEHARGAFGHGDRSIPIMSVFSSIWINLVVIHDMSNMYIKPFVNGTMWANALLWASGTHFADGSITDAVLFDRGIRDGNQTVVGSNVVIDGGNVAGHSGTASSLTFHRVLLGDNVLICNGAHVFQSVGANVTVAPRTAAFSRSIPASAKGRSVFAGAPGRML